MPPSPDDLLLPTECAKRLRITVRVLRAKVNGGVIPCIKLNERVWRFHWLTVLEALSK